VSEQRKENFCANEFVEISDAGQNVGSVGRMRSVGRMVRDRMRSEMLGNSIEIEIEESLIEKLNRRKRNRRVPKLIENKLSRAIEEWGSRRVITKSGSQIRRACMRGAPNRWADPPTQFPTIFPFPSFPFLQVPLFPISPLSKFPSFQFPLFPSSPLSKFPSFQVPLFPSSPLSKFPSFQVPLFSKFSQHNLPSFPSKTSPWPSATFDLPSLRRSIPATPHTTKMPI